MIRLAAAGFVALHGAIHLIGFAVPWRLAELPEFAYTTTVLNGSLDVGDTGVRLLGIGWLIVTIAFIVGAVGIVRRARWALQFTAVIAVASTILCVLGLPDAVMGIAANVVIVAGIASRGLGRGRGATLAGSPR